MIKKKALLFIMAIAFAVAAICVSLGSLFLVINRPLPCDNLIIEGWMPVSSLETELDSARLVIYKNFFVTGIRFPFDTLYRDRYSKPQETPTTLYSNGTIYLSKEGIKKISLLHHCSQIEVYAHGDSAFHKTAVFFVSIADSVIGGAFTKIESSKFDFSGNFTSQRLRLLNFQYGNDLRSGSHDRNLYLDSVTLDGLILKGSDFLSVPDNVVPKFHKNFPFRSDALFTEAYLKILGFKYNYVTVDTFYCGRNMTWAMSKSVSRYLEKEKLTSECFNILTYNLHSRRSFVTYSKSLSKCKIGVIVLKEDNVQTNLLIRLYEYVTTVLDEYESLLGNLFYR